MKNKTREETPLVNIERSPLILSVCIGACLAVVYYAYTLFNSFNPLGFLMMIPGTVLFFQSLMLIVNPFAIVFENRIEINQSMFHNKVFYFTDLKKITENKQGKLFIVYHDDEAELLNLFGIRASHLNLLKSEAEKYIAQSLRQRNNSK